MLRKRLYVDDFLEGADSIKKAEEICQNSKVIMLNGGFNLRKWNSNSMELIDMINSSEKSRGAESTTKSPEFTQDDESYAKAMFGSSTDEQDDKLVKVLGMNWNNKTDELLFNFTGLVKHTHTLPVTKKSLLKIIVKVSDPLGFLAKPLRNTTEVYVPGTVFWKGRLGQRPNWNLIIEVEVIPVRARSVKQGQNPKMLLQRKLETQFNLVTCL